ERAWMEKFTSSGFDDSFREFNPEPHNYTWWSYRANARNNNKGWRIDYHMTTKNLKDRIKRSVIMPEAIHSDHCPILLEIDRKSTRLNSSHVKISYAVFCLTKKNN